MTPAAPIATKLHCSLTCSLVTTFGLAAGTIPKVQRKGQMKYSPQTIALSIAGVLFLGMLTYASGEKRKLEALTTQRAEAQAAADEKSNAEFLASIPTYYRSDFMGTSVDRGGWVYASMKCMLIAKPSMPNLERAAVANAALRKHGLPSNALLGSDVAAKGNEIFGKMSCNRILSAGI
ncbi:hypothetical protein [Synechococcus elongatus]|uniref:Uncharacterized protein n=1 Tax=Synechococcus elongatus PCC 11801 TaxID=2219813 RepID=A0AAN1QLM3_SYNEL|nr:hypothetical protein [Synechococcus elongatus]AZB71412.1 hypothetical protein DOP62_00535 [Synechococcus elongatus PCC 11801]